MLGQTMANLRYEICLKVGLVDIYSKILQVVLCRTIHLVIIYIPDSTPMYYQLIRYPHTKSYLYIFDHICTNYPSSRLTGLPSASSLIHRHSLPPAMGSVLSRDGKGWKIWKI